MIESTKLQTTTATAMERGGFFPALPAGVISMFRIVVCCGFIALGAHVRIPLPHTDVPMTLQLLGVLITGMLLSSGEAGLTLVAYLFFGACGLPVFALGSPGFWGPTGGFLIGFLPAAWLMSVILRPMGVNFFSLVFAGLAGMICVFGFGIGWRTIGFGQPLQWSLMTALTPFLAKAILEVFLAAVAVNLWKRRRGTNE